FQQRRKRGKSFETNLSSNHRIIEKYKLSKELLWVDQIPQCPVFRPLIEDFKDPFVFLHTIAPQASKYGMCKIVSTWKASVPASDVLMKEQRGFEFKSYIQHLRLHEWNVSDMPNFLITQSTYNYQSFEKTANEAFAKRFGADETTIEYGVNIDGSAFFSHPNDPLGQSNGNLKIIKYRYDLSYFLLNLSLISNKNANSLYLNLLPTQGITFPMLHIGMLFSTFAWHVEDHFLYSINYHHSGAPKTWYGVPGHVASQFDKVARDYVYDPNILSHIGKVGASALLAENTTMFPPNILLQHNVPVHKAVQMAREYVITFPRAYHAGFSQGIRILYIFN
ncbi:hypothetical protein Gorai_007785, partial [Gossypium raimondii]|nr:hypothetical protein [Gossypium raimondii]